MKLYQVDVQYCTCRNAILVFRHFAVRASVFIFLEFDTIPNTERLLGYSTPSFIRTV